LQTITARDETARRIVDFVAQTLEKLLQQAAAAAAKEFIAIV